MNVQFRAQGKNAEIWLYDQVGESFFGDGVSAKSFQKELTALGRVNSINLRINSPGGDVFDGLAIYNQLRTHPARVVVDIDGVAASIASIIAMAGDEIRIASNAMMMVHNPRGFAAGDSSEMQRVAALLTQVKGNLSTTYADRTGNTRSQLEAWMNDETWMNAETALHHGFADSISGEQRVAACFAMFADYRNTPSVFAPVNNQDGLTPARDIAAVRLTQQAQRMQAIHTD